MPASCQTPPSAAWDTLLGCVAEARWSPEPSAAVLDEVEEPSVDYAFVIVSSSRASFDALKFGVGAERIPIVPHSVAAAAAAVQDARHHA